MGESMQSITNRLLRLSFGLGLALILSGVVQAAERVPQTSNDLPFYARLEAGLIHTDGEWAAIAFYRSPGCVRDDFNLLDFFDIPLAFGCRPADGPYMEGFGIYKGNPMNGPIQSRLQNVPGQTVPVWFVSWSDLQTAIVDGVLTIGELEGLSSLLVGEATFYTETLHPYGAAKQTMLSIDAWGYLEDGRKFAYQATEAHGVLRHVRIVFE